MQFIKSMMLLCLVLNSFGVAKAQQPDKTESPYFYIPCQECDSEGFPLLHTEANVNIAGVIADVEVKQIYKNDGKQPIEAIYVFPASTRAAVYGMEMKIGERTITAKIEEKQKARQDYEKAKTEGKRASLLEQHRPNVFQMNVANIMPGDKVEVSLKYTELLVPEEGTYEFVYPTVVGPRYAGESSEDLLASNDWVSNPYLAEGQKAPYSFDLNLCLKAGIPVSKAQSTSHKIKINYTSKSEVVMQLDPAEKQGGNRDFILQYQLKGNKIENGLLVYEGKAENYFLMMVQPPKRIVEKDISGREYIFIVDISGSMHGFPIETSKTLLRDLIGKLRPTDQFNVLLFAGSAAFFKESSVPATKANIDAAIASIDRRNGSGGTNMLHAIKRAMAVPKKEGYSRSFVIATDGYVNVEAEAFDYIRDHLGEANFFSFGIGSSVNRHLIEGMARVGMGEPFIVTSPAEATPTANKLRKYIQSPLLTDIKLQFEGAEIYDMTPSKIPDLMGERPVVIFGKFKKDAKGKISLTGRTPDGIFKKTFELSKATTTNESRALSNLWARHKIQQLGDYTKLRRSDGKEAELIGEITQLGLKHNLLTAFTSFIAIDSEVVNQEGNQTTVKQPLPLPEGVSNHAVGNAPAFSISAYGGALKQSRVEEEKEVLGLHEFADQSIEIAPPQTAETPATQPKDSKLEEAFLRGEKFPPPPSPPPTEEVFTVVEEMPRFTGCEDQPKATRKSCADGKMMQFIYENLKFPKRLNTATLSGTIVVQFVISKEGTIKNIKLIRSLSPELDKEIIRVVRSMPKWIPGKQRGKAVDVLFNLPVKIHLK